MGSSVVVCVNQRSGARPAICDSIVLERHSNQGEILIIGERFDQIDKRIEQSEKNITARFEDLKQEVRGGRR